MRALRYSINVTGRVLRSSCNTVKAPLSYGATDELGWKPVQDQATVYDLNATILYLLGLDHERLTYYHNGAERRLTDVHGHVLSNVLA